MADDPEPGKLSRPGVKVRLGYAGIFFLTMILALLSRGDIAPDILRTLEGLYEGQTWFGKVAVYRVAAALTVFHLILAASFYGYEGGQGAPDFRTRLQNSLWCTKITFLLLLTLGLFFLPNFIMGYFASISIGGATIFLFVQVLLLLRVTWEYYLATVQRENGERLILALCALLYLGGSTLFGAEYFWFVPVGECGLNIFFVTLNIILGLVLTVISISVPDDNGWGLFPAGIMYMYTAYATFSALNSQPVDSPCNALASGTASDTWALALGFVISAVVIVYACLRVSSQTSSDEGGAASAAVLDKENTEENAPTIEEEQAGARTYSYSKFHLVFACGAMYMAVLMTGWNIDDSDLSGRFTIDKSVASMYAKLISLWVAIALYIWAQIAPLILTCRDFD